VDAKTVAQLVRDSSGVLDPALAEVIKGTVFIDGIQDKSAA
jgi:hypothetical protein